MNLSNDFEVRKETLRALGGNPDGLANIYEVDLEILKLIGSGEQGIPDAPIDGVQYARQNGEWTPVESGVDWNTIKQKLAEDGVESIKFIMGNEQVILTASEVKTLLNQTVLPDAPIDGKQYARQDGNWTVVESGGSVTPEGKYMTITVDKSNSGETIISPTVTGSLPNLNLQYRINNGSWNDFIVGTTADIHVIAGDFVQFKGNNPNGLSKDDSNYIKFAISGNTVHLSGNVMSLLDGVGDTLVIPNPICFYKMFENSNVKTVSMDFLPATTLTSSCYWGMFKGVKSLVNAPELPSKNIYPYCYNDMFKDCKSLVTAPSLPATTIENSCYSGMFSGCTSLVKSPEILPATELKEYCYSYMFYGCTSLLTAPSLTATMLANYCYNSMFNGCTSLVQAPALPATTLSKGCYKQMFMECSNLVQAPELPAPVIVSDCYWRMFYGCKKLKYIKSLAIEGTINEDGTTSGSLFGWLDWVSNTGTFEKPDGVVYGTGSIPEGWTVKEIYEYTEAPKDGNQYARQDGAWTVVTEGISDAPSDGKTYGRNNGAWAVVESVEPGISDAPSDGQQYARQDGNWTVVESGITDAPSDGKTYGRNNGTWTPVESGYPIKQGVQIDNNVVSVENYGIYTKLNGNFISYESGDNSNYVRIYDKLEVFKNGEKSEANFIDVANAGNGVVKTSNGGKVKFWSGTQQEYDAIATKDANTLYIIK